VLGDYLRDLRRLYERYGYHAALYGHYGQGCVHSRVDFDLASAAGITSFRHFLDDAADLCVRYGGSLSGEHGDGQARAALLPKMYGPELVEVFREFKAIWDPGGKMNPAKVVDPASPVENLRLGARYRRRALPTTFAYPADEGDFAKAVTRCVGVGACRSHSGTVMCPSYQVTREEEHSTRGRARLLFELLNGDELKDGWRDPHVRDALDLCLSCKGCKHDCPVGVDMAEYKAEFLSHWFGWRHPRPRAAYALGRIMYAARLGSLVAPLANAATHNRVLAPALKRAAGVHPERDAPRFAATTFRHAWAHRPAADRRVPNTEAAQRILLWPDTFTDHFRPSVGVAAVRVLEDAGCDVRVAGERGAPLCCGRPLFDWGLLSQVRRMLQRTLEAIGDDIDAGTPLIVLEPSCASVFRDELTELLPRDERASRLAKLTLTLPEFLEQRCPGWVAPATEAAVMVQGHCHDRSVPTSTPSCGYSTGWARASASPRPDAAAWPAPSVSRPSTVTSPSRSASNSSSPQCGQRRRPPPSWPTGSAATSRSGRRRHASRCTSPSWSQRPLPGTERLVEDETTDQPHSERQ
jgi:Fe-S oxidoreductase